MILHGFVWRSLKSMVLRPKNLKNKFKIKFSKTFDFIKHCKFVNKKGKGVISAERKYKLAMLTRTCPLGLALAGPDMSEFRLLVKFRTFRIEKYLLDVISQ